MELAVRAIDLRDRAEAFAKNFEVYDALKDPWQPSEQVKFFDLVAM